MSRSILGRVSSESQGNRAIDGQSSSASSLHASREGIGLVPAQTSILSDREVEGLSSVFRLAVASRSCSLEVYYRSLSEFNRIANNALDLYELYIGDNAFIDFTAPPAATSATLPFNYAITPPLVDTKVVRVVVRKRNRYNLQSFNQWETKIEIDTNGDEVLGPLTAPASVAGYAQASGNVLILASYTNLDRDPADTWKVWISEGVDPNPSVDTPALEQAFSVVGLTSNLYLQSVLGPYTTGATLHIIVAVERAADSAQALAPVFQVELPALINLAEEDADLFGGASFDSLQ